MRFAVVVFACVVAAGYAQTQTGPQARAFSKYGFAEQSQFNNQNRYPYRFQNQYPNQFQNQYQNQYQNRFPTYKPFVSSTTFAPVRPFESVSVTPVAPSAAPSPAPVPVAAVPVAAAKYASDSRSASIVKYGNEINPDGNYNYFFETDNGIAAQAQGTPRDFGGNPPVVPDVVQGSFSWTSPEGKFIGITYHADENGYHAEGDAIPQPPEIPPQIARALAYIAKFAPQK